MAYEVFDLGDILLQSKRCIRNAKFAYKTYGTLNAAKDNAIVYPTSFAANHDDAAWLIGPGRVLDPKKYFIIVPDAFGNGLSSSPSNTPAPHDGNRFPHVTIHDNVVQQHRLLTERFGIETIRLAMGWSLGGAQAFEWAAAYPEKVERLFAFQSAARTSRHFYVFSIAYARRSNSTPTFGRAFMCSILNAACGSPPASTRHGASLDQSALGYASIDDFLIDFWEGWFLRRDANNLLAQLWTGQHADLSNNDLYRGELGKALASIQADTIVMPSTSDLYFPVEDAAEESLQIPKAELRVLNSKWGHVAGEGMNDDDTWSIEQAIADLLAR